MAFLDAAVVAARTDRLAGAYEALRAALPAVAAKLTADVAFIYGDGTAAHLPLPDPAAINALGPAALRALAQAKSGALYAALLAGDVAALSSYLQQNGGAGAGLPPAVRDVASLLRLANGCPDPSPQGNGAGSTYARLAHPSYAALVSLLTGGGSALPPDCVFAPSGLVLGRFHAGGVGTFAPGRGLLDKTLAPFAPIGAGRFAVRCGNAPMLDAPQPGDAPLALTGAAPSSGAGPGGSLYVVVTGLNQAGTPVTWRGDAGTGLSALGDVLPASALAGASGGANGGTAGAGDRLLRVTNIALDGARASSASGGDFDLIVLAERGAL